MTAAKPVTPADWIARAKDTIREGADPAQATAAALIAIAESLVAMAPRPNPCCANGPVGHNSPCEVPF